MTNADKSKEYLVLYQIPAGLQPKDTNIEFIGITPTKEVIWLQNGTSHYFKDLPLHVFRKLTELYLSDAPAVLHISTISKKLVRQVELYTYYLFGGIDNIPDYRNGILSTSENFTENEHCISRTFANKIFSINGNVLNQRDLTIINLIKKDTPDKVIADNLGISMSTLDFHKRNLFKKANVLTKVALVNAVNYAGL